MRIASKKKNSIVLILCFGVLLGITSLAQAQDVVKYADPFIGSEGGGHVFIGSCLPYG